ncbi:MAG: LicD family protein [Bacteroidales bacterium]|jgi:lipopolysaccharide cholinephosphotransferase|nr:LicD family protein [Bacteroidales bacterium]
MDANTLKKLHAIEIEILNEFVRICDENNLDYFLVGGSLLGAIRHKGFIPWDDDIDIGMPRKDYEKMIEVCACDLNKKYYIKSYKTSIAYWPMFAKICKHNTIFFEDDFLSLDDNNGIFIDIFPYDNTIPIFILQKFQNYLITRSGNMICRKIEIKKKIRKNILKNLIVNIFSFKFLQILQQNIMTFFNIFECKYIISWGGKYGIANETFLKDSFYPLTYVFFEGQMHRAPKDWDLYLRKLYGSHYMELPPIEKRIAHVSKKIIFDTTINETI